MKAVVNNHRSNLPQSLFYRSDATPVGKLILMGDGEHLLGIGFTEGRRAVAPEQHWRRDDQCFEAAHKQLAAYFAGELKQFDLPLRLSGTAFQKTVWHALLEIPYGETTNYRDLALGIGRPKAVRAVGAANGANPLAIVVPCHRVLGSDGSLTGFGGGLPAKALLLKLESSTSP